MCTGRLCVVRHNGKKLLFVDLAILVEVKLIYHRLSAHPTIRISELQIDEKSTYNSSSSRRSPISFATRRRLRMDILPVLSSSNS